MSESEAIAAWNARPQLDQLRRELEEVKRGYDKKLATIMEPLLSQNATFREQLEAKESQLTTAKAELEEAKAAHEHAESLVVKDNVRLESRLHAATDLARQLRGALDHTDGKIPTLWGDHMFDGKLAGFEMDEATIDAIQRALSLPIPAMPERAAWRDIETAPKDGKEHILLFPGRLQQKHPDTGFWWHSPPNKPRGWADSYGELWGKDQPTHWMPLPPAPTVHPFTPIRSGEVVCLLHETSGCKACSAPTKPEPAIYGGGRVCDKCQKYVKNPHVCPERSEEELERCDACYGTGQQSIEGLECRICHGTGRAKPESEKCSVCGGEKFTAFTLNGESLETMSCPHCNGSGEEPQGGRG